MKKTVLLAIMLIGLAFGGHAQKLSKDEVARYESEIKSMLSYLEETLNFIGDSTASAAEKEIVFTDSWSKIFVDDKVQVEDDLDVNRKTPINKDVQAYLKDIDFFFKQAQFKFDVQSIANSTRDNGSVFFKVTTSRHLTATTINDEQMDNIRNRFIEINLDRLNNSLKIASIYTTKVNEAETLRNWWNSLSLNWKSRLGQGIRLYDSIPLETVGMISGADFMASYPTIDPTTGETVMKDKLFKTEADMKELHAKLKLVTQKQEIDISGIPEIITLNPISELSELTRLDISGTSVDDISLLRSANKLKSLNANSTMIDDISALKYCITLEELELANTNINDLGVLRSLRNLKKINLENTMVSRLTELRNCPNLNTLNLSGCKMANIGILQDLTQLTSVDLSNTAIRDLSPLSQLNELQRLDISQTPIVNLQPLAQLDNLRELYCSQTNISDLSPLKNHKKLTKIHCDQSGISDDEASAFTKDNPFTLVIYDTEALRNWWNELPIYWKAIFSKQIQIDAEPTTEQLHQVINMQELEIADNTYIQNLMPVVRLTNLKHLDISNTEINNLYALQSLTNLETLSISGTYINSLEPLGDMANLKQINIMDTPVSDLTPLTNDNSIEVILADRTAIGKQQVLALKERQRQVTVVYHTEELEQWWNSLDDIWKAIFSSHVRFQNEKAPNAIELQKVTDLQEISIGTEFPIGTLLPIADFIWIEKLDIGGQSIRELAPLANKPYLRELYLQNTPVSSLKPIENNLQLESLNIENTQVGDLGPLSRMTQLVTLNAGGTPIKSLKPLQSLSNLEYLSINNTGIRNLTPIEDLAKLKTLKAYNTKVSNRKIESLQQKRLDMNIIFY